MTTAVIRIADTVLVSSFESNQLIFSKELELRDNIFEEIFKLIKPLDVDQINILMRAEVLEGNSKNSVKLGSIHGSPKYLAVNSEDINSLEVFAKATGASEFKVFSFFDIYKHLGEEPVIILDEYYDGNVILVAVEKHKILTVEVCKPPLVENVLRTMHDRYGIDKFTSSSEGMSSFSWDNAINLAELPDTTKELIGDSILTLELEDNYTKVLVNIKEEIKSNVIDVDFTKGGDTQEILSVEDDETFEKLLETDEVLVEDKRKTNWRDRLENDSVINPEWKPGKLEDTPKLKKMFSSVKEKIVKEKEPSFISSKDKQGVNEKISLVEPEAEDDLLLDDVLEEAEEIKPNVKISSYADQSTNSLTKLFGYVSGVLLLAVVSSLILGFIADGKSQSSEESSDAYSSYLESSDAYLTALAESKERNSFYFSDKYYGLKMLDTDGIIRSVKVTNDTTQVVIASRDQKIVDKFKDSVSERFSVLAVDQLDPSSVDNAGAVVTQITFK